MSINWSQVSTLVGAQFRLDLRHPKTGHVRSSRLIVTGISYGFSSLVLVLSLMHQEIPPAATLFVIATFSIVLVLFALVSSYEALMGHPREHASNLVLPASEQTHFVARLANILIFFGIIILTILLPVAAVIGPALEPAARAPYLVTLLLCLAWTTLVGLGAYWLLVLYTPARLFKPVTSLFQGLVVLVLVMGYQWIGTERIAVPDVPWWPAQWFVRFYEGRQDVTTLFLAASALGVALLFAGFFPLRYFDLLRRSMQGEDFTTRKHRLLSRFERLELAFIHPAQARASYHFAATAFLRDRIVRGRIWPALLMPVAFAVFGLWIDTLNDVFYYGTERIFQEPATQMHLSMLIILFFTAQSVVRTVQFSDYAEAAWVFETLPVRSAHILQMGAQRAITYRLFFPLFVVLWALLCIAMPPWHAALHVGFWWAAAVFVMRLQSFFYRKPPFSLKTDRFAISERFLHLVLSVPLAILFITFQVFVFRTPEAALLFILGMAAVNGGVALIGRLIAHLRRKRGLKIQRSRLEEEDLLHEP